MAAFGSVWDYMGNVGAKLGRGQQTTKNTKGTKAVGGADETQIGAKTLCGSISGRSPFIPLLLRLRLPQRHFMSTVVRL